MKRYERQRTRVERQLRVLALLDAAEIVGLDPIATLELHTLAYLSDALAPVWGLPLVDAQILKGGRPYFPALQRDVDGLVAIGVVDVHHARYVQAGGRWQVDAEFSLHRELADPVLLEAAKYPNRRRETAFAREVVYAASSLGNEGIAKMALVDASYASPIVGEGAVIDLGDDRGNLTADVALRFADLLGGADRVSEAELVHLYVRHLFGRLTG